MKLTENYIKQLVTETLEEQSGLGFKPVQQKLNELKAALDAFLKERPEQKEAAMGRIKRYLGIE